MREGEREERGRGASTRLVLGRCFSKYAQNRTRVSAVLMRLLAGARRRLLSAPPFHDAIARARARVRYYEFFNICEFRTRARNSVRCRTKSRGASPIFINSTFSFGNRDSFPFLSREPSSSPPPVKTKNDALRLELHRSRYHRAFSLLERRVFRCPSCLSFFLSFSNVSRTRTVKISGGQSYDNKVCHGRM